jgi:hypothetical protein
MACQIKQHFKMQSKTNKMKKILLITLIILSVKGFSQVDSTNVNLMINTAINQQNKTIDLQLKETRNNYDQLQISLDNYQLHIDSLHNQDQGLKNQNKLFATELRTLSNEVNSQTLLVKERLLSLENLIKSLTENLEKANINVSEVSQSASSNTSEILNVSQSLTKKQQYGIYIFVFALILILLVYIILSQKWNSNTKSINAKQKEIFEKQIQDSLQLAEWLSSESKIILEQPKSGEIDHSFAKRVADEIVRMQTNLSRMDESIKGFKQLNASVRKLEQSLNSNQYELEDLLNKSYNIGMNIEATMIIDEKLEKGKSIITRIIKPQINYKGKLIQAAHVEVSESE